MDRSLEGREQSAGYRMINRLTIRNFRCFESLELQGLPRVNIIVGENASGKTALLESLFFAGGGSPELAFRLRAWRGFDAPMQVARIRASYDSLWKELFFDQDLSRKIFAQVQGSLGNNYEVEVLYAEDQSLTLPLNGESLDPKDSPALRLITFKGKDANGKPFELQPDITPAGLTSATMGGTGTTIAFLSSTVQPSSIETTQRFSDLRKEQRHKGIVKAITKEFPIVSDLDIEIEAGAPMIFATVAGRLRKMRLGLVSGGLNKLVSLLINIQTNAKGAVLIDEIENGFHYSKLGALWEIVRAFGQEHETQLFVSTHSWECLKAAQPLIEKHAKDFGLIRTAVDDGKHVVKQFTGHQVLGALKQNGEIR
jgi:predicted ATPase